MHETIAAPGYGTSGRTNSTHSVPEARVDSSTAPVGVKTYPIMRVCSEPSPRVKSNTTLHQDSESAEDAHPYFREGGYSLYPRS